jgi:GDP-D-mannose 3', 5'-epimerase
MKRILVCGAGGFIGSHLVKFLKEKGYWVRGVDLKYPKWSKSPADEFLKMDLRYWGNCLKATKDIDEVYNLAADMGGMGFIMGNSARILHNNSLINIYTLEASRINKVKKYFFSSSVCVYPVHRLQDINPPLLKEEDALPAFPQEGYGWEKLIHEIRCQYYYEEYGLETRIARFQNCYGPEGEYEGGREKAPAALCRKVILAKDGEDIEVWGDGKQTRSFMYINDNLEGIYTLMNSDVREPVNLGKNEHISINDFAKMIIKISGKKLGIKHIEGPQGIRGRNFDDTKAKELLKWTEKVPLEVGMKETYKWIKKQINLKS